MNAKVGLMGFFDRFRSSKHMQSPLSGPPTAPQQHVPPPPAMPVGQVPRFAVLDVETTGLSPTSHRVIEVAVVTTDAYGKITDEWSTRVNPQGPVGATHIHGITAADVAGAPIFTDVAALVTQRLAGAALVAHNAPFDLAFLAEEFRRAGWVWPHVPTLCTLAASEYHLPGLDRRRLADCCWAIGTPLVGAHSALGDARATAGLLAAYLNGPRLAQSYAGLPQQALGVAWPTGPTLTPTPFPTAAGNPTVDPIPVWQTRPPVAAPTAPLVALVDRFSLGDALDEGAPEGSVTYLETLAEALEDGEITAEESSDLTAVAEAMNLTQEDVAAANRAFVLALAHEALDDGKVSRAERAELTRVADLLDVNAKVIPALLDRAEAARDTRLSEGLGPLPDDWAHGDPLRVGDKVVFTGCDAHDRPGLEIRSEELGVRVIGSVSPKVALLISDGTMDGGKAARARELGTRVVHPSEYRALLEHLQPALPREVKAIPKPRQPRPTAPATASGAEQSAEGTPTGGPSDMPEGVTPADVRAWGRDNGWEVGVRGRLNKDLLAAYLVAHEAAPPST